MTKEVWKFYKEIYNARWGHRIYEVSSYGRVKCNGEIFECSCYLSGYKRMGRKLLHRIVAELFLPDWDPNKEVGHKDCNILNNMASNLYMCSHKENLNNPLTLNNFKYKNKTQMKSVLQYTKEGVFIKEYKSGAEAARLYNIKPTSIFKVCKGIRPSAAGYIWKYKNINN